MPSVLTGLLRAKAKGKRSGASCIDKRKRLEVKGQRVTDGEMEVGGQVHRGIEGEDGRWHTEEEGTESSARWGRKRQTRWQARWRLE